MQRNRSLVSRLVVPLLVLGILGCSTTKKFVRISSEPDGAQVQLNGMSSGTTTYTNTLNFKSGESYSVTLKKAGFKDAATNIDYLPKDKHDYFIKLDKIEEVKLELATVAPQKTAEGAKLELVRRPTLAYLEVIERSPTVAAVTRITSNEDPNAQMGGPVLSPSEDVLVYELIVAEGSGNNDWYSNIQKMLVGAFGQTRLTYGKWTDINPAFMPSGKMIVFSSNRTSPNKTLWRVNADNTAGGITRLTSTQAEDYSPSVASNGVIAYASLPPRADTVQIWTLPAEGNLVTQLREGENPCVSPDCKRILFSRRDKITGDYQLWVMSVDGTEETQLTQTTERADPSKLAAAASSTVDSERDLQLFTQNVQGRWSPDGKWIVYASNEGRDSKGRRNFDIWLMAADGSSRTQLTTNGSWDDSPCWDRSGELIYFRSNRGAAWNIWRLKPTLENKRQTAAK